MSRPRRSPVRFTGWTARRRRPRHPVALTHSCLTHSSLTSSSLTSS
ncbi:hypothetical protein PV379_08255 [Streptomyces caniscabiei]|nr:hypothetical protein [Streptomyces caniscabiei]MDX2604949.1 hypothetical protein [Streptomyces caniscabiei]MDX2733885.1 hypothetical protein [Streptomyces caniscabiei]MDX2777305.1 hypothetical protein [Streptomyces caniscabiei]